ncbi:MAG: DUF3017 domain-containing protein [Promicromonosporaceae bacterium]|nr:DUF3017 domain-containing protein [Promicromonosporaceae bacterium]
MDHPPAFPGPALPPRPPRPPRYRGPGPRASLFVATIGVVLAAVVGAFFSARVGALTVSATLLVAGCWRAAAPRATHAVGIAVRSKSFDVFLYIGGAVAIAFLALSVPMLG